MALDLAFTEYGSGPPLLILHGLFGSAGNWSSIARRLAADHRVLAVDLRNHGASPWAETMTYDAMAEDVLALMARQGLGPTVVLGHSMGGKVAMVMAFQAAERIERLIAVDVAPVAYPPVLRSLAEAMRAVDLRGVTRRSEVDALLRPAVPDDATRMFLLQNLVSAPDGLRWRLNLDAIIAGMDDISGFPALRPDQVYGGPTLFLRGERSGYIEDRHKAVILRHFPRTRIETIPGAGHWVHAEQPEAFLRAVTAFLATAS